MISDSDKQSIFIVDDNDEVIGHKLRGTLIPSDIYRVSCLWLYDCAGSILLAQRAFSKSHDPGKWGPAVAGTVEVGETYLSNIIKEAQEEIGLTIVSPRPGSKLRKSGHHNYFCQYYTYQIDRPAKDFIIQTSEVAQVAWIERQELKLRLKTNPEAYLASLGWLVDTL